MSKNFIRNGFIAAGLTNVVGGLIFSKFLTNNLLNEVQPDVMSNFGMIMIMIWGLAYIAVANDFQQVKWLVVTFAIEKFAYAIVWFSWFSENDLSKVLEQDLLTGIFYSIYGPSDFTFGIFFAVVAWKLFKRQRF